VGEPGGRGAFVGGAMGACVGESGGRGAFVGELGGRGRVATMLLPCNVGMLMLFVKSAANIAPDTTWYVSSSTRSALFAGSSRLFSVPAGSASNASFVGAKRVKGPGPERIATRSAALRALTSVDREGVAVPR